MNRVLMDIPNRREAIDVPPLLCGNGGGGFLRQRKHERTRQAMGYRDSEEYKERERLRKKMYGIKRKAAKLTEKAGKATAKTKSANPAKPANVGRNAKPKPKPKTSAKPRKKADRPKSLLDVAADILKNSKEKPGWHPEIIVNTAISNGLWTPGKGKTPAATLWKNILGEIKSKGKQSRFVKSGPGEFRFNEKLKDGK